MLFEFQFPSNGKVYCKFRMDERTRLARKRFNSLQTGKCIARTLDDVKEEWHKDICFNSLQTGKCIASRADKAMLRDELSFNSLQTGKCIASMLAEAPACQSDFRVSIPFKRESVLQDQLSPEERIEKVVGFNSLQTGKCIARTNGFAAMVYRPISFNSLQTGKCIARDCGRQLHCDIQCVSIPFKRESVLQVF